MIGVRWIVAVVPRVVVAVIVAAIVAVISIVIVPIRVVAVGRVPVVVVIVPIRAVIPAEASSPDVVIISVIIIYGDWRNFNFVFTVGEIFSVVVVAEALQTALIFAHLIVVGIGVSQTVGVSVNV